MLRVLCQRRGADRLRWRNITVAAGTASTAAWPGLFPVFRFRAGRTIIVGVNSAH